jgi:hypothetical protein
MFLSDEFDNTTSLLDLLLSGAGDVSGLDNEGGVDSAFTELNISARSEITSRIPTYQLELAELLEVDDGNGTRWGLNLSFGQGDELESVQSLHV